MKKLKKYHIGIRHEDYRLHTKLHYIAKYEGRSANAYILFLIRRNIEEFEVDHGEIPVPEDEKKSWQFQAYLSLDMTYRI